MGLFSRKYKNPARGTATVAGSTACPSHASSASCRMDLVVSLPGMPATPTKLTTMVRADKWPFPGTVLPIEIDLDKPSRMRILWDEVPSGRERSAAAAQQIADQLNASPGSGIAGVTLPGAAAAQAPSAGNAVGSGAGAAFGSLNIPPGARVVSSSVSINGQAATPEQIAAMEALTGMDLDGDGKVGR